MSAPVSFRCLIHAILCLMSMFLFVGCATSGNNRLQPNLLHADWVSPEVGDLLVNTGLQPNDPRLICVKRRHTGTQIAKVRCETVNERDRKIREADKFLVRLQN